MPQYLYALLALRSRFLRVRGNLRGQEDRGATAVEYGLAVALIAVALIGVVFLLAGNVGHLFSGVSDKVPNPGGQ